MCDSDEVVMSELLSLFLEDAKEVGWGNRRTVSATKRATREPKCNAGEWSGQPVDGQATSATFAGLSQRTAEGEYGGRDKNAAVRHMPEASITNLYAKRKAA